MSYVTGFEATAEDLQAAMSGGGDLDEQSDAARARIAEILRDEGVISASPAP